MSADNWRVCPRCLKGDEALMTSRKEDAEKAYGKVAADVYLKMLEESKEILETEQTLGEDYTIGTNIDGKFFVKYNARCTCGFNFEFNHKEQIKL